MNDEKFARIDEFDFDELVNTISDHLQEKGDEPCNIICSKFNLTLEQLTILAQISKQIHITEPEKKGNSKIEFVWSCKNDKDVIDLNLVEEE